MSDDVTAGPYPGIGFDPYDEQRQVAESDARFRAVAAGRRSGKTTLAAAETVYRALRGGPDWHGAWVTPSHQISETGFTMVNNAVDDDVVEKAKSSAPFRHLFTNGARLDYLTVDGDANVSFGFDWIAFDETAKGIPTRAWEQDLRPTLSDTAGEAMFISTPDGRELFHDVWSRGQSDDHPQYDSWRWSTYANPYVPDAEIDEAREQVPERIFAQEYLAEFRDDTGGVFDVETATEAYTVPDGHEPPADATPPFRVGADLARSEDYLALVALDADGWVTHLTRERGLTWPQIQRRIERVAAAHGDPPVAIDATRDNKLVADLETAGVVVRPVTFSAQRKQALVENLAAGIEAGEVTVPAETMLATELGVFEYETTSAGNIRYGAPEGHHDDTVDALAMAYDLPAGGGGVATARASFGDGEREPPDETGDQQTIGDALPDPTNLGGGRR
jgi:hypothetical protein